MPAFGEEYAKIREHEVRIRKQTSILKAFQKALCSISSLASLLIVINMI